MAVSKYDSIQALPAPEARPTLVVQTLLTMARQRGGVSESRCRTVLEFMETEGVIRGTIRHDLERHGLTRVKFAVLLALLALDPISASPTDLALHTGVCRPCVSTALTGLVRQRWVICERAAPDRRFVYVSLTEIGRRVADEAAMRCLLLLEQIALLLTPALQTEIRRGSALLQQGALSCSAE